MRYTAALLNADIKAEIRKLGKLVKDFEQFGPKLSLPSERVYFADRAAIGCYLLNFHTGCENIFKAVVRFCEKDWEPSLRQRDLLKRMLLKIEGCRPPVIDLGLFESLRELQSFRQEYLQFYMFELDWERERVIAKKLGTTKDMLEQQIMTFMLLLENMEKGEE